MRANIYIMLGNKTYNKICVSCDKEFTTKDKKQRFCSHGCYGILKVCKWCGKEFRTTFENQDFCSRACGGLSRRTRTTHVCKMCGKEYEVQGRFTKTTKYCSKECMQSDPDLYKREEKVPHFIVKCEYCGKEMRKRQSELKNNHYYCSKECQKQATKLETYLCIRCGKPFKRATSRGTIPKYCSMGCRRNRVIKQCAMCGKPFDVAAASTERRKYCSKDCKNKAQSLFRRNARKAEITIKCANCGKEFLRYPSQVNGRTYVCCSRECLSEYRSKHNIGSNNPNWNNGSSFEPYCEKFNKYFRQRVRAYFGDVCFICGLPAEEHFAKDRHMLLTVHHVHYDRGVCCNGNPEIFVPLCYYHNIKCNSNREWWVSWFESILLKEPYNGKTYFTHEEYVAAIKNGLKIPQLPNYNGEQQRPKIILRKI